MIHKDYFIFPNPGDLGRRRNRRLPIRKFKGVEARGPYASLRAMLDVHVDLLTEDFLRTLNEQVNEARREPRRSLHTKALTVRCGEVVVVTDPETNRSWQLGIKMHFDRSRMEAWEDAKYVLTGNLVLLTAPAGSLAAFDVGFVGDCSGMQAEQGDFFVVRVCQPGRPHEYRDHEELRSWAFLLIASRAFHFPYQQVTQCLRSAADREDRKNRKQDAAFPFQYELVRASFPFQDELVRASFPSRAPAYADACRKQTETLLAAFKKDLNPSQWEAMRKVTKSRVALVQGPPGTGKTHLGCKIAELFVRLKHLLPNTFPGPVLVVTTTNHAVDEFLDRCLTFTEDIIHGYSAQHARKHYGPLQAEYNLAQLGGVGVIELMQQADILAMTTTRAACTRSILDGLSIKLVIVEEAAEALEGHVLACIVKGTEHLIQLGDHKQLQPKATHLELAKSKRLDLSLFERLIGNGAGCPMLSEQRRMRPAIADLVRVVYPGLTDHPSTRGRPPVAGVDLDEPVFFLDHQHPETKECKGFVNEFEAEMAALLCSFLVRRGHEQRSITVITTYTRQLALIRQRMGALGKAVSEVRATTVDGFQGEENKIIILSLVRSNADCVVGFMKNENRACVALSRARDGLFILGNMHCLSAGTGSGSLWSHAIRTLERAGRAAPVLPLVCRHGKRFATASIEDARAAVAGCVLCQLRRRAEQAEGRRAKLAAKVPLAEERLADAEERLADAKKALLAEGVSEDSEEDVDAARQNRRKLRLELKQLRSSLAAAEVEAETAHQQLSRAETLWKAGKIDAACDTMASVERKIASEQRMQPVTEEKKEVHTRTAPVEKAPAIKTAPVKKASPIRTAPVEKSSPIRTAPVKKASPIRTAPVEKASPIRTAPVEKASPIRTAFVERPASTRTAPVERPASTRTAPVEKSSPIRTAPVEKSSPIRTAPVERPASTRTAPMEKASPIRTASVEKASPIRTAPVEKASPIRTAPVERPASTRTAPVEKSSPIRTAPVERPASIRTAPVESHTGRSYSCMISGEKKAVSVEGRSPRSWMTIGGSSLGGKTPDGVPSTESKISRSLETRTPREKMATESVTSVERPTAGDMMAPEEEADQEAGLGTENGMYWRRGVSLGGLAFFGRMMRLFKM